MLSCVCGGLVFPAASFAFRPLDNTPPSISGTAQQGRTLSESHGFWAGFPTSYSTSYSYQWLRCSSSGSACVSISSANGSTYVPVAEDVGHRLRVKETVSNVFGHGNGAKSSATAAVLPAVPVNTSRPTITGTAQQGHTLTALKGSWTNEPTGVTYQWMRCSSSGTACVPIPGATSSTYVQQAADLGHTLKVVETASNEGGTGSPAETAGVMVAQTPTVPAVLQATPLVPPTRVVISTSPVRISTHGSAPIVVRCPVSATGGCAGTLTIRLVQTPAKRTRSVAARCGRGCRPLGSAKYEARAGQRITVRVHIASYGRKQLVRRKKLRVTLTAVTSSGGQTATAVRTISLKARAGGR